MRELWIQQKSDEPDILSESIKFLNTNVLSDSESSIILKNISLFCLKEFELENFANVLLVKYVCSKPGWNLGTHFNLTSSGPWNYWIAILHLCALSRTEVTEGEACKFLWRFKVGNGMQVILKLLHELCTGSSSHLVLALSPICVQEVFGTHLYSTSSEEVDSSERSVKAHCGDNGGFFLLPSCAMLSRLYFIFQEVIIRYLKCWLSKPIYFEENKRTPLISELH